MSSSVSGSSSATTSSENGVSQSDFAQDIGSLFKPSVSTTDVVSLNQDQKIIC